MPAYPRVGIAQAVPTYNQFRVPPVTLENIGTSCIFIQTPTQLKGVVAGMISLLFEPELWRDNDPAVREALAIMANQIELCGDGCDFCGLVAGCIENDERVIDALTQLIDARFQELIEEYVNDPNNAPIEETGDTSDDLDCVYGALNDAYELVLDYWLDAKVIIDAAADFADAVSRLPIRSWVGSLAQGVESLLAAGTTVYDAYVNAQSSQDAWVCGVFDSICKRGEPYTITNDDIDAGFNALASGEPIPFVTALVRAMSNYPAIATYWAARTNDTCSDDWKTLCTGCGDWTEEFDFVNEGARGWAPYGSNPAIFTPGQGWTLPPGGAIIRCNRAMPLRTVTQMTVEYVVNQSSVSSTARTVSYGVYDSGGLPNAPKQEVTTNWNGDPAGTYQFTVTGDQPNTDGLGFSFSAGNPDYRITKVTLSGKGTNPF